MYKRDEHIEEENLDWDKSQTRLIKKTQTQKENVIFSPTLNSQEEVDEDFSVPDMPNKLLKLLEKNLEFASVVGVLILPYFVGFILAYVLFYTYSGMTIMDFLTIDKEYLLLQLWSIGAYIFITLWVFWAFSQVVKNGKQMFSLS